MKCVRFMTIFHRRTTIGLAVTLCLLAGCVSPKYHRPSVQTPAAYKELPPADLIKTDGWKVAQPKDDALRGKWWEIFNEPELNALEEKINVSNQTIASAAANFLAARAMVKEARSQYFPTVTTNPAITWQRPSATVSSGGTGGSSGTGSGTGAGTGTGTTSTTKGTFTDYTLPFDATWQPDLFGRIRNTVKSAAYGAQASAADLENTRLTIQAAVASDYFQLRGQDALQQLLDSTVTAFQQSLDLTRALYDTGIDSEEDVAQAETQLEATQAQAAALGIQRAQFEHAIAMLIGQPASTFSIPVEPLKTSPPAIPFGVPSQLLERRPDVAAAERLVAQANAQIGIARAAYFPTVTLSATAGFESTLITSWFTWPSRFFAAGPAAAETLFDAGLRRATVMQFRAQYDETVANYRQAVLTAFQQVEDNLVSLRILSVEIQDQDAAVKSAERTLALATDRYKLGIDPYLNVLTAQTALLSNRQAAVNLRILQMTASGGLIQALGGGWDASQLPSPTQLVSRAP
ncbi:MAG TPA: efflux transporter outer membrane subunit [Terriglobales bacterium]|jgi:NodT family efflux transporter outer membrane factor (OMF) lipoprotein|nr:efflux transporter outer membrane subunit [Terriglobales bacterium]